MRLAAIKRFNKGAPFIVLDDVVTSYDRDHRLSMANLIRDELADFQVIVVTHEEQFFRYLKEVLESTGRWSWQTITKLDPCTGPVFSRGDVSDKDVTARIDRGEISVNELRQLEEEWLNRICHDFVVTVPIPKQTELPKFPRETLADSLEKFLKSAGFQLEFDFFPQLKQGVPENTGSHFQADAANKPSRGDLKTRWSDFQRFRSQFQCKSPTCRKTRFKRNSRDQFPRCAKCEETFKPQPP